MLRTPVYRGRKRAVFALTALAASVMVATGPAAPASAEPDIDDVQAKADRLYHQAEVAQERFNDAKVKLKDVNADLKALRKDQIRQQKHVGTARSTVEDSIVSQYESSGAISAVGEAVVSEDPTEFVEQLTTMSEFTDMQTEQFADFSAQLKALNIRKEQTKERQQEAAALTETLGKQKSSVEAKYKDAKELLGELKAEQREELEASRSGEARVPTSVPASGRAAAAVDYAMAQVGDAYVYGAAGPSAFDCSGLTMMAWAQAGVGLPHSSSAQMGSGSSVSQSDLQPGDLVFYYSPVSHVGMYIGNGMIVHAANPGDGVTTASVNSMPYSGAVRPG